MRDVLSDPRIELRSANGGTIAANTDWDAQPGIAEVTQASTATGAFALAPGSKDAALEVTVPPGGYTVLVEGGAETEGIALIEVYEIP